MMMNPPPQTQPQPSNMLADGTEEGKIFVGGLSWETNEDKLRNYFSEFGEVTECLVMKNQATGKSRGFGFVTFSDPNSVRKVLRINNHQLDGRTIDPKECNPRTAAKFRKDYKQTNISKIFLGGLPPNITETNLREFFSKYGKVTEAIIMFDQEKKKSRGFGFLSFDSEDSINKVVAEHFVTINGKQVEVKRAEPQHTKSGTPAPNGNIQHGANMGPMFLAPWNGLWQTPPLMPPMNGMTPAGYAGNAVWNPTTAAAAAAAIAATTMAGAATPPNWAPYAYSPGWPIPGPYGQPPPPPHGSFGQPGANPGGQSAPTGHGQPGSTGPAGPSGFLPPPNNVASMNQNVPNGTAPSLSGGIMQPGMGNTGMGNFPHETNNYGPGRANAYGGSGAYVSSGHNTHGNPTAAAGPIAALTTAAAQVGINVSAAANWNQPGNFGAGSSSGQPGASATGAGAVMQGPGGATAAGAQVPTGAAGAPHHNDSAMVAAAAVVAANSYNQSLQQFHGSRIVSQNQSYHPYRRS